VFVLEELQAPGELGALKALVAACELWLLPEHRSHG
jgi:hypothetical protein